VVIPNNEFQITFKDFKLPKLTISFITNLFEEKMEGSENDEFNFSVFKKNVCETDLETSNVHLDSLLKTSVIA
jgi:hypothetical protein